jgi:transcriptional regulator with GAF, ATPase, and Fis domain
VTLDDALDYFEERNTDLKAVALIRKAIVERSATRLHDALSICNQSASLFGEVADPLLAAHFHHIFANVLNQLSSTEHRQDYVDRALIEYAAASLYFERAGHLRYQACVYILAQTIPAPSNWTNFSLRKSVLQYEGNLIRAALSESDGAVTKAAHLLGFKHHQSLVALISGRHPELLEVRRPPRPRRKHFMQHPNRKKKT